MARKETFLQPFYEKKYKIQLHNAWIQVYSFLTQLK